MRFVTVVNDGKPACIKGGVGTSNVVVLISGAMPVDNTRVRRLIGGFIRASARDDFTV